MITSDVASTSAPQTTCALLIQTSRRLSTVIAPRWLAVYAAERSIATVRSTRSASSSRICDSRPLTPTQGTPAARARATESAE